MTCEVAFFFFFTGPTEKHFCPRFSERTMLFFVNADSCAFANFRKLYIFVAYLLCRLPYSFLIFEKRVVSRENISRSMPPGHIPNIYYIKSRNYLSLVTQRYRPRRRSVFFIFIFRSGSKYPRARASLSLLYLGRITGQSAFTNRGAGTEIHRVPAGTSSGGWVGDVK